MKEHAPSLDDLVGLLIQVVLFVSIIVACWTSHIQFGIPIMYTVFNCMRLFLQSVE